MKEAAFGTAVCATDVSLLCVTIGGVDFNSAL